MPSFPKLSYACPILWSDMRGDEKERFCSKCARTVVNLSLLTEAQRTALLAQTDPRDLCVAYYRRLSGEFVTAEAPATQGEKRSVVQFGVAALSLGAAAVIADGVPVVSQTIQTTRQNLETTYQLARDEVLRHAMLMKARLAGEPPPPDPRLVMMVGMMVCPTPPPVLSVPSAPSAATPAPEPTAEPTIAADGNGNARG